MSNTISLGVTAPHLSGQSHRASANFDGQNKGTYITFSSGDLPASSTFNVMNDRFGPDNVVIKNAGLNIKYDNPADENMYIADISGASAGDYTLKIDFSS